MGMRVGTRRALLRKRFKDDAVWTPASPTSSGGVLPHTWLYPDAGLWQDTLKTVPAVLDGDVVGAWVNQGSDVSDFVQAVTANKPTLRLAVQNGQAVLRFDGANDYLLGNYGASPSAPVTVFAVAALDATFVNDGSFHAVISATSATIRFHLTQHRTPNPDEWSILSSTAIIGGVTNANWNIWTCLFNGASTQFWHNGISQASGAITDRAPVDLSIGGDGAGGSLWKRDIAEILIYDPNLSTADANELGAYFDTKYNISYTDIP